METLTSFIGNIPLEIFVVTCSQRSYMFTYILGIFSNFSFKFFLIFLIFLIKIKLDLNIIKLGSFKGEPWGKNFEILLLKYLSQC